MQLETILQTLESTQGTDHLVADDLGCYALVCEDVPVSILPYDEGRGAFLFTRLASESELDDSALAETLLQVNHRLASGYAASFSLDPDSGDYCLQKAIDCEAEGPEGFSRSLLEFVDLVKLWKPRIEQYEPEHPAEAAESAESAQTDEETFQPAAVPSGWISV